MQCALCRLRISIVCHRWQNILYSTPALWRSATVAWDVEPRADIKKLQLKLAAVRRVSHFVESLEWRVYAGEGHSCESVTARDSLVPLLADLQPSRLTELQLEYLRSWPAGATPALQRLSRLEQLEVGVGCTPTVQALAAVTSNLRSLELNRWEGVDQPLMARLLQLTQLTRLSLSASGHTWGALSPLTRLTKLRSLKLRSAQADGPSTLQPPEPAAFHGGLEQFDYIATDSGFQVWRWMRSRLDQLHGLQRRCLPCASRCIPIVASSVLSSPLCPTDGRRAHAAVLVGDYTCKSFLQPALP